MTAKKEVLEDLHTALAAALLAAVKAGDTAAFGHARQFLKDNHIDTVPEASPAVQSLAKALPFPAADDPAEFTIN